MARFFPARIEQPLKRAHWLTQLHSGKARWRNKGEGKMEDRADWPGGEPMIALTADIVAAHVSNNSVAVNDLPQLIHNVHGALSALSGTGGTAEARPEPKVPIRSSIKPDYIVCLEDGKKFKMLKRHLMTRYQMTPEQYRQRWGLPRDYPMVAPSYADRRRALAKSIGLGSSKRRRRK